uniref:Uncharacterized protein n=1 Tax=Rangifer tarandus platyrhynchus TaxID=3082113 RepID=A0ACB0EMZ9_RANTA|nr:unnamed protein product [Rangifer tarandus platyrhynchus]
MRAAGGRFPDSVSSSSGWRSLSPSCDESLSVFWVYSGRTFFWEADLWLRPSRQVADVDRPESQEVLVSNEVCLRFGIGCLSGSTIAPFWLWLPLPAPVR